MEKEVILACLMLQTEMPWLNFLSESALDWLFMLSYSINVLVKYVRKSFLLSWDWHTIFMHYEISKLEYVMRMYNLFS